MEFKPTPLAGLVEVVPQKLADERGFFARSFCEQEFAEQGISFRSVQCNISYNEAKGTLRGMHYQVAPKAEPKLVRCTAGVIYDVAVDLRPDSESFTQWYGVELSAEKHNALYIPEGFAHGFITLTDKAEVFYHMGEVFSPEHAEGVRWDDPAFGIEWPMEPSAISEKDANYPDFVA